MRDCPARVMADFFSLFLLSGSHWSLMSVRVPAMSVFPPVRKDRVVTQLPLVNWRSGETPSGVLKSLQPHTSSSLLFLSITGKRRLCTGRRILTTKWRSPVRSSEPAPWGERVNPQEEDSWCLFGHSFTHCLFFFIALSRFKISKVIVVGDLAVGKTCLINRWAHTLRSGMSTSSTEKIIKCSSVNLIFSDPFSPCF